MSTSAKHAPCVVGTKDGSTENLFSDPFLNIVRLIEEHNGDADFAPRKMTNDLHDILSSFETLRWRDEPPTTQVRAPSDAHSEDAHERRKHFLRVLSNLESDKMIFNTDVRIRELSVRILTHLVPECESKALNGVLPKLLGDARARLATRVGGYDDRKLPGSEAMLGCLETEGWGSLETSLKAIRVILRSVGSFSHSESETIVDIVLRSISHTNRYAREQGQLCLAEILRFSSQISLLSDPQTLLIDGLHDNWSQVRYPSLIGLASFFRESIRMKSVNSISDELLTHLLINRHFPAEGIRRLSQDVWRIYTGPQGGRTILIPRLPVILWKLSELIDSDNHSQREAIISLCVELTRKVLPLVSFSQSVEIRDPLVKVCINGLEDDSWFTRLLAVKFTSYLFDASATNLFRDGSELSNACLERIVDLLVLNSTSSFPELCRQAVDALLMIFVWSRGSNRVGHLLLRLSLVVRDSISMKAIDIVLSESSFDVHSNPNENRPMYSCGSLLSNRELRRSLKHSTSDECCSSVGTENFPDSKEIFGGLLAIYRSLLCHPLIGNCVELGMLRESFAPLMDSVMKHQRFGCDLREIVRDIVLHSTPIA